MTRYWGVFSKGELQYPLYCDGQGDCVAVYRNRPDARRRAREFRESNPGHRFTVSRVTVRRVPAKARRPHA